MNNVETNQAPPALIAARHEMLSKELEYYESVKDSLLADGKYKEKFVAINHQRVVGVDTNKFDLARKLREEFPDDVILIKKVVMDEPARDLSSSVDLS